MQITVGNLIANSGTKVQGFYEGDGFQIPVTIICGKKPGKTAVITSGFHGSEYDGIKVGIELANEIATSHIVGNLIIANAVNLHGFYGRKAEKNPVDKGNIYSCFPGDANGTESEKIAYAITNDFLSQADYFIDLHGGNMYERVTAFTYYAASNDEIAEESRTMARAVKTKYMVMEHNKKGAIAQAGEMGIPAIIIERGGSGMLNFRNVKTYRKDVINVLRTIGLMNDRADNHRPFDIVEANFVNAGIDGCYMECTSVGDYVRKGDILAYTTDMFGKVVETHKAPFDGVMLYQIDTYACEKGKPIFAIGKVRAI